MKRLLICSIVLLFISCAGNNNMSHTETAQIVAESFFTKDESALKKYTTSDGYASLITVQNMIPESDKEIKVEILNEAIEGEIAWVKYKTSFDGKSGIFKLVKENDEWKVTSKGPREKGPF
ncbi:hypothetical protein ACFSQJ_16600 [Croceitalea marina]|uniref:DUF4878 domain-containing protein n=1 Tax=Croceitalea marina TaxID=1775166 RepID=A0ABW5N1D4_9FLAO|nr:hypothetical protein [Maribacter sp. 4G9]PIB38677.1 hypothetical protein BFP75_15500 [Maribacter sp. 4G9]|tara:strand:- start:1261 stop:1623 length:363 start_codon:yes stop_codon:yes gene_type:complete